jgi:hypothetical protein
MLYNLILNERDVNVNGLMVCIRRSTRPRRCNKNTPEQCNVEINET